MEGYNPKERASGTKGNKCERWSDGESAVFGVSGIGCHEEMRFQRLPKGGHIISLV